MYKTCFKLLLLVVLAVGAASCGHRTYKNIAYFQDVEEETSLPMEVNRGIVIQPQDKISIVVSTTNSELARPYNLPRVTYSLGAENDVVGGGGNSNVLGYVVDNSGNINMAGLGQLHVAGMNRWELSNYVRQILIDRDLLKDPNVTVEFMNFKVSVLGEVGSPGTYNISGDKVTILQALSLAGDLTIMGKRDNITVLREQGAERTFYHLDLRDTDIFNSPAYYLQQSDVVYVYPSKVRAGQSRINENNFRNFNFWISIPSMLLSMTTSALLIVAIRNGDYFKR